MSKNFDPPSAPGVYLMKDGAGKIIYVGKAKDLKKRVGSYFHNKKLDDKTLGLVGEVESMDFIITNNDTEALILESNLIKKFQGKYNVELRLSYRYPFVKITNEAFPRIEVVRGPKDSVGKAKNVFGPFVDGTARKKMIEFVEKTFKIRTCRTMPKRACLKFYMGQCTAPCIGNISKEEYAKNVEKAVQFFSGKKGELLSELEKEMKQFSDKRLFELAIEKRDALFAVSGTAQKQSVERFSSKDQDFISFHKTPEGFHIALFNYRRGTLHGKKSFNFASPLVGADILEDFLLNFYAQVRPPNEIVLQEMPNNSIEIQDTLSKTAGYNVLLTVPQKGEKRKILALVEKNLDYSMNPKNDPLVELKNALFLPVLPRVIECFDVSHLGGKNTVASMVSFLEGKPNKAQYRQFRIRLSEGGDDYAAMQEVVGRRYGKLKFEKEKMPDLVLIDGGKGQLSAAQKIIHELGLFLPVVGLAKREEELFIPARQTPIVLGKNSAALKVLMRVRDEAHRFANRYRKKLVEMETRTGKQLGTP